MTGIEQKIKSIDTRLKILRTRRLSSWEVGDADKVAEYTELINDLLDERIAVKQKATA